MAASKATVIKNLKLDAIAKGVAKDKGWTSAQKNDALRGYRAYLSMRLKRGPRRPFLAIGKNADEIWHAHIANTVQYRNDCKRVFGRFLDHTPLPHPNLTAAQKRQFAIDQQDYKAECVAFGVKPMPFPIPIPICI